MKILDEIAGQRFFRAQLQEEDDEAEASRLTEEAALEELSEKERSDNQHTIAGSE